MSQGIRDMVKGRERQVTRVEAHSTELYREPPGCQARATQGSRTQPVLAGSSQSRRGEHGDANGPRSTASHSVMAVVAQDKPRSEEQGEGGGEDIGEMRRQRKSLRVRGSQGRGDGEIWEQSLGQEQRRRQPWSDAERYMEMLWHGPSQWEKRWTEPWEGEEESPVRETEGEGKGATAGENCRNADLRRYDLAERPRTVTHGGD